MELSQYPQPIPLIVKCGLDPGQVKRIRYADSRSLTFTEFKSRISAMLQLSSHKQHRIIYDDDDGEQCEIACDDTLAEAISYFMPANGQITSISMKVSVNLISTLTLSDFGGSEIDDGASDVASSYWGSYRSPSLSGSYGNRVGEGSSRQSNSMPFRSVEGTSSESQWRSHDGQSFRSRSGSSSRSGPQHRSNSQLIPHENEHGSAHGGLGSRAGPRRTPARTGDFDEHDGDEDDDDDGDEGAASYTGSFINSAAPLSQWGSSSLAQLQHHGLHHPSHAASGLRSVPSFHDLRQHRVSEIRSRSAEMRARAGRSPPSSYYPSHLSGSQLGSIPEPGPVSHSYHTQSQWDEMSSVSGSIEPSLPSQELAVAAASQRNEAARAQVEEMERRILQMQAILDLEKRKLKEEEQWQQDLAAAAMLTTSNGPPVASSASTNPVELGTEADRHGKRKVARISAADHDSSEESEAESVQTISNFSIMPGRSAAQHRRTASGSEQRPPFSLLGTIEEPPKGFMSEDEAVLRSLQQPPKISDLTSDERIVGEDTVSAGSPGTSTAVDGAAPSHHPTCSSCNQDVEADSLRYVCAACGPNRQADQQSTTDNAISPSQSRKSSTGSGKTASAARVDSEHHDPGAASTSQWSSVGSPQSPNPPEHIRGRTSSTSSNSSSSSSSSSSNSSLLSSHTQVSSSSSSPGPRAAPELDSNGVSPPEGAKAGYELCFACFQGNAAREHLQNPKFILGRLQHAHALASGTVTLPGPQHAFFELLWQDEKWTPIEDELPDKCTHCMREDNWPTGRYKCSACDNINLCGECFKRVDDIHPPHVFLRMPIRAALMPTSNRPSGSRSSSSSSGLSHKSVHTGIKCAACGQQPITGTRWHCANCIGGRDFCGSCEADEEAMAAQAEIMGHGLDHLLIKIPAPIDRQVVFKLGNSLLRAQQRLTAQAERVAAAGLESPEWTESADNLQSEWDTALRLNGVHASRQREAMEQAWQSASLSNNSLMTNGATRPAGEQRGAQCFNCQKSLQLGPRYICANCPLGQLTPGVLGLNLCHECAEISQELHDPSHFFIKIQSSRYGTGGGGAWTVLNAHAIARLRARTGDDIEAPLLPILYKDARAIATGPPLVPARVRCASSSTLRTPGNAGNGVESDEEEALADHSLTSSTNGATFAQRAWPQFTSTLAMARNGLLAQKYQKNIRSAISMWIQNTTNEFEMYRIQHSNARGAGPNLASVPSRFCSLGRPSRWFGSSEGTKSPAYVPINELVHPSILCDSCYECIEGTWYRCCSCKESFDLCGKCEARVEHDSRHVFAVFKQPVDMALFKSLIDHASEASGHSTAARAMLPVLLVGEDE
ncbi:hypothetical protein OC845_006309 [Tilletia horrida]|nr:hypothetical protein OC845_006309 [Tilletia horrida]